jgi:hypothetical protein
MELCCGSYERGVICPRAATHGARARAVVFMLLGGKEPRRNDGRLWDMLLYADDAPRDRILFCLLRLSHWFVFQYCLLSLLNTCMKNFAYFVYGAYVTKLVYNLGSPNFHSLSPGLRSSMRRTAIFPTSCNYVGTVKTPVWIANIPSISFTFRHLQ